MNPVPVPVPAPADGSFDPFSTLFADIPASGQALYDQLMAKIEPELVSDHIPLLRELYKNESPEERSARGDRYAKAFGEYDKQFAAFTVTMTTHAAHLRHEAMATTESMDRKDDEQKLSGIEDAIASS